MPDEIDTMRTPGFLEGRAGEDTGNRMKDAAVDQIQRMLMVENPSLSEEDALAVAKNRFKELKEEGTPGTIT